MTQIPRIIPVLLLQNAGLVKTYRFSKPRYIGDPINAVKIFNEKYVDELIFLDIEATVRNAPPPLKMLGDIAGECFMPLGYGGGIRTIEMIKDVLRVGVEKVCINTHATGDPEFIRRAADSFGSSTIVVSMDVKKNIFGKNGVYSKGGRVKTRWDPVEFAVEMNKMGAGELVVNSIDRDGTMEGYDLDLIRKVAEAVDIPVIACGGAGSMNDFREAVTRGKASAVAAGSMFVFHGRHRGVLISYPSGTEIMMAFTANRKLINTS